MNTETTDAPVINPETTDSTPAPAHVSVDDAISKALDEASVEAAPVEEADEQPAPKAKEQPKEERAEEAEGEEADGEAEGDDDAKAEEEDGEEEEQQHKPKPPKDRKPRPTIPAPEKFGDDAKAQWASVPHVVRADIERVTKEYEGAMEYYRPVVQRYEELRQFDDIARANGVDLRQSLERVAQLEDLMTANPLAGLNRILLEAGPRKPDGQPVSLYELATHIVQMGPEGYQKAVVQMPQQQQPQTDPQVKQLQEQLAQMQAEQTRMSVVGPFAQQNPRFNEPEVQDAIAQILRGGMVPVSLPAQERLAKAYEMAVRLVPASDEYADEVEEQEEQPRRRVDGSGATPKQIRGGTPGNGASKGGQKRPLTRDEAIKQAMAALR